MDTCLQARGHSLGRTAAGQGGIPVLQSQQLGPVIRGDLQGSAGQRQAAVLCTSGSFQTGCLWGGKNGRSRTRDPGSSPTSLGRMIRSQDLFLPRKMLCRAEVAMFVGSAWERKLLCKCMVVLLQQRQAAMDANGRGQGRPGRQHCRVCRVSGYRGLP